KLLLACAAVLLCSIQSREWILEQCGAFPLRNHGDVLPLVHSPDKEKLSHRISVHPSRQNISILV
ncbi:hypothetical protein LINPERPRIM_LOCUS40590, partial [Linum perenne]